MLRLRGVAFGGMFKEEREGGKEDTKLTALGMKGADIDTVGRSTQPPGQEA